MDLGASRTPHGRAAQPFSPGRRLQRKCHTPPRLVVDESTLWSLKMTDYGDNHYSDAANGNSSHALAIESLAGAGIGIFSLAVLGLIVKSAADR